MGILDTTKLNIGGLSNNGAVPKVLSNQQNTGLFSSNPINNTGTTLKNPTTTPNINSITNPQPVQTGQVKGLLDMHQPTTPVVSKTDAQGNTVKFAPPATSSAPNQAMQNYQNYLGQNSDIAKQIGYTAPNQTTTQTPTNPTPTIPATSQQQDNSQINPTTGVNNNGSTTTPQYTPPDQGVNGVSQGGIIGNLVNQSNAPSQAYLDAQAEAKRISDLQTQLSQDYAQKTNNIAGTAGFLTQQNGEQGLLNNQYNTVQNSLSSQYQGATNRLGAANTQQGLQVTAGTNAGNLNAPITGVTPGTQIVQPSMLGSSSGVSGGISDADMKQYATMAANGQLSAVPSFITSNPVLNAQLNNQAKTINPNYNPVTSLAQSNITTQQTGNVAVMTAAYKSATNLGSQLKDLISTYGVNPADLNAANAAIQKVAQNVSSPQYQALNNLVTDLVSTYSSILTPGSSTDTARATAASLLNDTASGKSIITTLNNLDDQAKAKIAGQTTGYGENPGASSGGGSSASGFGWNG